MQKDCLPKFTRITFMRQNVDFSVVDGILIFLYHVVTNYKIEILVL